MCHPETQNDDPADGRRMERCTTHSTHSDAEGSSTTGTTLGYSVLSRSNIPLGIRAVLVVSGFDYASFERLPREVRRQFRYAFEDDLVAAMLPCLERSGAIRKASFAMDFDAEKKRALHEACRVVRFAPGMMAHIVINVRKRKKSVQDVCSSLIGAVERGELVVPRLRSVYERHRGRGSAASLFASGCIIFGGPCTQGCLESLSTEVSAQMFDFCEGSERDTVDVPPPPPGLVASPGALEESAAHSEGAQQPTPVVHAFTEVIWDCPDTDLPPPDDMDASLRVGGQQTLLEPMGVAQRRSDIAKVHQHNTYDRKR